MMEWNGPLWNWAIVPQENNQASPHCNGKLCKGEVAQWKEVEPRMPADAEGIGMEQEAQSDIKRCREYD
jgi:hypothetical protein